VAPALAVAGGLAGAWIADRLGQISRPALAVAALAFLIGVFFPIREMVRLHPYQYTHFNIIAGGIIGADHLYMLDYWGLAVKEAARGLRTRLAETMQIPPDRGYWRVAMCAPQWNAKLELGPQFIANGDPKDADFALTMGVWYCDKLAAPILVEVEREGVVYARVYDIRGRTVTSLFSLEP